MTNRKVRQPEGLYGNYEWLYNQKINLSKTNKQIADEFGWSERVVEKWVDIYRLGARDYKNLKHISPLQREFIIGSLLGDGHIAGNNSFIVSHNEDQKDYLFWKYELLKDLCKTEPSYYPGGDICIRGMPSHKKGAYRFNTKIITELNELKQIPVMDIITHLTPLQIAIWFLDDGYRGPSQWELCTGTCTEDEQDQLLYVLAAYGIHGKRKTYDRRYLRFNADSCRKIDAIILQNIPNDLDIIQYKILSKQKEVKPE